MDNTMSESALRSRARRTGYSLHKSRARFSLDNFGGYQVANRHTNTIVAGERYDLSLDDVQRFLDELAHPAA